VPVYALFFLGPVVRCFAPVVACGGLDVLFFGLHFLRPLPFLLFWALFFAVFPWSFAFSPLCFCGARSCCFRRPASASHPRCPSLLAPPSFAIGLPPPQPRPHTPPRVAPPPPYGFFRFALPQTPSTAQRPFFLRPACLPHLFASCFQRSWCSRLYPCRLFRFLQYRQVLRDSQQRVALRCHGPVCLPLSLAARLELSVNSPYPICRKSNRFFFLFSRKCELPLFLPFPLLQLRVPPSSPSPLVDRTIPATIRPSFSICLPTIFFQVT